MGIVVRARHVFLDQLVAVKLLHPELLVVREVKERFVREAQTAARLRHKNVVEISDFGVTPEGLYYLVMEYLEGRDLHDFSCAAGQLTPELAARVGVQVCDALERIHEEGFIHRDLKPENIWLMAGDALHVKVLDFGIAGIMAGADNEGGENARLTKTGKTLGTPNYMAPEQGRGGKVDGRVDVYALGCILWELVNGAPAFEGKSALDVLTKHILEAPRPPSSVNSAVPVWFDEVVLKCLHKVPDQRYATAAALRYELERGLSLRSAGEDRLPRSARNTVATKATPEVSGREAVESDAPTEAVDVLAGTVASMRTPPPTVSAPQTDALAVSAAGEASGAAKNKAAKNKAAKNKVVVWGAVAAAVVAAAIVLWPPPPKTETAPPKTQTAEPASSPAAESTPSVAEAAPAEVVVEAPAPEPTVEPPEAVEPTRVEAPAASAPVEVLAVVERVEENESRRKVFKRGLTETEAVPEAAHRPPNKKKKLRPTSKKATSKKTPTTVKKVPGLLRPKE